MRRQSSCGLRTLAVLILFTLVTCSDDGTTPGGPAGNFAMMETSMGDITLELYPAAAPLTVANFRRYVSEHFYDGLIFHRVIQDFVIQGGGYMPDLTPKPTHDPIPNEAGNGLSNVRGTIAMVHFTDPQSATSQFFINLNDNLFLDHKDNTQQGYGYAVFGRVVPGMDVVDDIAAVPTGTQDGFNDVPVTPVVIRRIRMTIFNSPGMP